ncbi:MAG: hypothetical protein HW403_707 [Dehalococcoidia bacterium]|nr:hypothetical protein [Dehalococcoidia bacterium]
MDYIKIRETPTLRDPILITAFTGWNDAGEVGTWCARFLIRQWSAVRFAEIDPEEFYVFTDIRPWARTGRSGRRRVHWPANQLYYHKSESGSRDFIILLGIEPQLKWKSYVNSIMELGRQLNVSLLVSLGGFLAAVPHTSPPRLTGSTTDTNLLEHLSPPRRPGYQGPTGIVGVMSTTWGDEGMPTASIWGNVPHYLQVSPNLKVAVGLVERLNQVLDLNLDMVEAHQMAAQFGQQVEDVVQKNPDLVAYVRQLEEQEGRSGLEIAGTAELSEEELPSGEAMVKDLEEFLRRRRQGEQ